MELPLISCTQKHWRLICLTVFCGKKWRTTSTFNCLNNVEMTYFHFFFKEEIDIERAVKQITLARGGHLPPLAKAICLTARAKSLMLFFFFSLFENSRERYRMFSPKAKFVIMILKQSGALPNVFAKSNF